MGRREMKEEEEKKEKLATESRQKKWWETPKRRASSRCSFCSAYSRFSTNDRTTTGRLVGVDYLNTWIINGEEEEEEAKDELSATRENCCCCCQLAAVALLLVLRRRKGCVDSFLLVVGATDPYGGEVVFLGCADGNEWLLGCVLCPRWRCAPLCWQTRSWSRDWYDQTRCQRGNQQQNPR